MSSRNPHNNMFSAKVSLYGPMGVYIYGKITEEGKIALHGPEGNYSGKVKPMGKITMRGPGGEPMHGKIKSDGRIALYDSKGQYYHGKLKSAAEEDAFDGDVLSD